MAKRRILLYGNSVILGTIGASLRDKPDFDVITLASPLLGARTIEELHPDVIIYDLEAAHPLAALSLVQKLPRLLLIGVDPATDQMLLWSGEHSRALNLQDLVTAIHEHSNDRPKDHSKTIRKKENKMKNLNKRSKTLLSITGIIAVLAILVVVYTTQIGGLFGASIIEITTSTGSSSLNVDQTITLSAHTSLSRCSWSNGNSTVVSMSSSGKSATIRGLIAGTAKISVKCGAGVSTGSINLTVNRAPKQVISPRITSLEVMTDNVAMTTGDATTMWVLSCPSEIWAGLSYGNTMSAMNAGPIATVTLSAAKDGPGTCLLMANSTKYTDSISFQVTPFVIR